MTAEVLTHSTTTVDEVVVVDVPVVEKTIEAEPEKPTEETVAAELQKELATSVSFKEETNVVGELPDSQKKALAELKVLVQEALNKHELTAPPPKEEKPVSAVVEPEAPKIVEEKAEETTPAPVKEAAPVEEAAPVVDAPLAEPKKVGIWGIPKVSLPWGRKSVSEAPKVEEPKDDVSAPEPEAAVVEEIKEEIVTAPVAEETKVVVAAPASEEPKEEGAATPAEEPKDEEVTAPAIDKPKKKKNWGLPKVNMNFGFSKKDKTSLVEEPKKEEEATVPATVEPKEEITVPDTEVTKEEITAPAAEETEEEVTARAEESREEVTVAVVEAPKEEITVPVEEATVPAAEPPAAEEPKDKEVISVEPVAESSTVEEPKEEIMAPATEEVEAIPVEPEEVSIWGVLLLADEKSDVVLLKFLRARDFKVKEAFVMLRNTVRWQKEFKIDTILEEDLGTELDKVVYISGVDKEGHPVCYNVYGEFQNKELYQSTFADAEKPEKFLRWRVQFLEKTIRKDLEFSPDGVCTFVQVNDLKASPGPFKRELKVATNQALQLLQDNYPEFVAKQVFINVPWYYLAFYKMKSPFLTQRTKSKFVFAGPSKSAETLFKYIAPEQVPVQYGGLKIEGEQEFTTADTATEEIIKPSTKTTIEITCSQASTLVWEARVIGWDVLYGAEFVPSGEGGYTVIIQKLNKIAPVDETVLSGSYKASEAGKIVLTFDNSASSKKKLLLYRSKPKPSE